MKMNDIENMVFDELGNLKEEFEIIQYEKYADGKWHENRRFSSGRSYFVFDDKIYYRCDGSLIELNMDFDSETCGACYKVAGVIEGRKKITGNEVLFKESTNNGYSLSLHKQSYSDGTCFYSLKDKLGRWSVNHGSNNINDLLEQMKLEKSIAIETKNRNEHEFSHMQDEMIKFYDAVIANLKKI